MAENVRVGVIVGNPKPRSRTYQAALLVAARLSGTEACFVIDVADLGAGLLDPDCSSCSWTGSRRTRCPASWWCP